MALEAMFLDYPLPNQAQNFILPMNFMLTGQPSPWENPHREIIAIEVETFLTLFHHYSQNQLIPGDQLGVIRSTSGGVPDDPPTTFLGPFTGALWPKTSSHTKNGLKPKTLIIHRGSIFSPKGVLWYFSILPPSSLGQKNGKNFFSLGSILDQYWVPLLLRLRQKSIFIDYHQK